MMLSWPAAAAGGSQGDDVKPASVVIVVDKCRGGVNELLT